MDYHNFLCEIDWNRSDMQDGYYAIPASFCNFDPTTGAPVFEYEQTDKPTRDEWDTDEEFENALRNWEEGNNDRDEVVPEDFVYIDETDETDAYRVLALMMHLDDFDASVTVHRNGQLEVGNREWLVLTDSEADDAYERDLDSYIDDCMEIPDHIRPYFDEEKWKHDARINGDRGQSLARYDGHEYDESTNEGTFYIFRCN